MALPNKEQYIPIKTIYIIQGNPSRDGKPFHKHGVSFNEEGRGSTTSYNDMRFLIKEFGYKDITKKHWAAKAKEWEKLVKAESKGKAKPESEPKKEDEAEAEKSK